jgi:hypothetical protein
MKENFLKQQKSNYSLANIVEWIINFRMKRTLSTPEKVNSKQNSDSLEIYFNVVITLSVMKEQQIKKKNPKTL